MEGLHKQVSWSASKLCMLRWLKQQMHGTVAPQVGSSLHGPASRAVWAQNVQGLPAVGPAPPASRCSICFCCGLPAQLLAECPYPALPCITAAKVNFIPLAWILGLSTA